MFLEQAFHTKNNFTNYLIGLIFIVVAFFLGQVPLFGYIYYLVYAKGFPPPITQTEIFAMMDSNWGVFLMLQSFVAVFLIFPFLLKKLHHQTIKTLVTAKNKFDFKRFTFSFLLWAGVVILSTVTEYLISPEDFVWQFDAQPFLILFLIAVVFIPIQAATEEFIFRGYLMQGIALSTTTKRFPITLIYIILLITSYVVVNYFYDISLFYNFISFLGYLFLGISVFTSKYFENLICSPSYYKMHKFLNKKFIPLIFTSVLFGLLHGSNPEVEKLGNISLVYYVGTGLMLGIITLMDDGMELALGFHVSNNLLTSLLVTADWTALQTHSILKDVSEPNAGFQILFPVFVVYPILLVIFANRYQWTHWKEKLTGNIVINYNNGSNEHTNVS